MIPLVKNFTFALAPNDTFVTDWVHFPSDHKQCEVQVHLQTLSPAAPATGVDVNIETSNDTVQHPQVSTTTVATAGSSTANITGSLGGMVRLELENTDVVALTGTISVWIVPKND